MKKEKKIRPLKKGTKYETLTPEQKEKYSSDVHVGHYLIRLWNHNYLNVEYSDY
jgi:plasmid maintenance system killer protein